MSLLAISFFMDDGPPPHPGHIAGLNPALTRLFVVGIVALFMTAGYRAAWRTRQARQGILAAVATGVIGGAILFAASFAIGLASRGQGGPWTLPFVMLFIAPMLSTVPGTIGALLGTGLRGMHRAPAS